MCGRYHLTTAPDLVQAIFELSEEPELSPRYNIAPTQAIPVVRNSESGRELSNLRWGLVPHYWRAIADGPLLINARAETLRDKPSFAPAFAQRRCLIPADGFYEWQQQGGAKQPFRFTLASHQCFAMAGIWERWTAASGASLESCAIITVPANDVVASIHHRMPAILPLAAYADWLDSSVEVQALWQALLPLPQGLLRATAVSDHVNSAQHDDRGCIAPAGKDQPGLF